MSQSDYSYIKKFLVIQTASIGDVILATPVIEKLHFHFPDAKIDFLVKKGNQSLFEAHPFLHKILIWDKSTNKYRNFNGLIDVIRDNKYDCVINIQRFAASGLLTIYSLDGKLRFRKSLDRKKYNFIIDSRSWNQGIYFFNFTSGSEYKQSGKVIIAK